MKRGVFLGIVFLTLFLPTLAQAWDCQFTSALYDPYDVSVTSCTTGYNNDTGSIETCLATTDKCFITGLYYTNTLDNCTDLNLTTDAFFCDATPPSTLGGADLFMDVTEDNSSNNMNVSWGFKEDGLVLYMPFEEIVGTTTEDMSHMGNDGDLINGLTLDNGFSVNGYAMSFDGASDYINISKSDSLNITGNVTLAAWVYPKNLDGSIQRIVDKMITGERYWRLLLNDNRFSFSYYPGAAFVHLYCDDTLTENTWNHIVGVRYNSNLTFFLNGKYCNSTAVSGTISQTHSQVTIGSKQDGSELFNGLIDDVYIFNRSLNATEIVNLYMSGTPRFYLDKGETATGSYYPANGEYDNFDTDTSSDYTKEGWVDAWTWASSKLKSSANTTVNQYGYLDYDNYNISGKDTLVEFDIDYTGGAKRGGVVFGNNTCEISPSGVGWGDMVVGEVGKFTIDDTIVNEKVHVSFENTYGYPIVVAYVMTRANTDALDVRVMNISAETNSADFFIQVPDHTGTVSSSEDIGYIVMERGTFTLSDGTKVRADQALINNSHNGTASEAYDGEKINITNVGFSAAPVVLHTLNSYYLPTNWSTSVVHTINSTSFEMENEIAEADTLSTTQFFGWIAVETNRTGTINGVKHETGSQIDGGADGVDDTHHLITYDQTFSGTPIIVVKKNSEGGTDGAWARGSGTHTSTNHGVYAEEDEVGDSEQSHSDTQFGFWAFGDAANLTALSEGIAQNKSEHVRFFFLGKNSSKITTHLFIDQAQLIGEEVITDTLLDDAFGFFSPYSTGYYEIDNFKITNISSNNSYIDGDAKDSTGPNSVSAPTVSSTAFGTLQVDWADASDASDDYFFSLITYDGQGNPSNLIENPNFESGSISPWVDYAGPETISLTANNTNYGDYAINVTTASASQGAKQTVSNLTDYQDNEMLFGCFAKTDTGTLDVTISSTNISGSTDYTLTTTWQEINHYGSLSATATNDKVHIITKSGSGTFFIDDCYLRPALNGSVGTGLKDYYCEETNGGNNSGWIVPSVFNDDGLNCFDNYSYRVKPRDNGLNEGAWSSEGWGFPLKDATCDYGNGTVGYCFDSDTFPYNCYYDGSGCPNEVCTLPGTVVSNDCYYDNGGSLDRSDDCTIGGCTGVSFAAHADCTAGAITDGTSANCWVGTTCDYLNSDPCVQDFDGWEYSTDTTLCSAGDATCCPTQGTYASGVTCETTGITGTSYDRDDAESYCTATATDCSAYTWVISGAKCCGDDGDATDTFCELKYEGGKCTTGTYSGTSFCTNSIQDCGETGVDEGGPWCQDKAVVSQAILNSTLGTNGTSEDLTVYINLTDADYDDLFEVVDFRRNGTSIADINLAFQINHSASVTQDYSTNDYTATINGATWTTDGLLGGAYGFDGDDYISTNYGGISGASDRSVSLWAKTTSTAIESMFSYGTNAGGERFSITNENAIVGLRVSSGYRLFTATDVNDGNWHHIMLTFSGTKTDDVTMYMDGVSLSESSIDSETINSGTTQDVEIGRLGAAASSPTQYFIGSIDEVKMYARALTADQVNQIYLDELSSHSNLALDMQFSRNTTGNPTGTVVDHSKFGNDGDLGNSSTNYAPTWNSTGQVGGSYWFDGLDDFININDSASLDIATEITISSWAKDPPIKWPKPWRATPPNISLKKAWPEKVLPGDTLYLSVNISDEKGIEKVTASMPHELGEDFINLKLLKGTIKDGYWEGEWVVHDTKQRHYDSIINATNIKGISSLERIKWYDPTSYVNNYSFSDTTNNNAYEKFGSAANKGDYDSEALSGDYTNLASSNNNRWTSSTASGLDEIDSQIYSFTINESILDINNITISWEGYGDESATTFTNMSIWNVTSTTWVKVASKNFTATTDASLSYEISSAISTFLNVTNNKVVFKVETIIGVLPLGNACTLDSECGSGNCRDGYCCDTTCDSTCQACDVGGSLGTCTNVPVDTDPDAECAAVNCGKGTCDGSGACDYYTTGEGACAACGTCQGASSTSCVTISNNLQDTEGSNVCSGTCAACQSGSCSNADVDTDPGDDCTQGSNETHGCSANVCDGAGACDVQESGDGGCPVCGTCSDSDIACEYHPDTEADTGCASCSICSGSEIGTCTDATPDTNWGAGLYGCVDADERCVTGTCQDCSDNSGYLYSDGCSGCAGQGGNACWKHGTGSCNSICSGSGGCVAANWNDNGACTVSKHFYSCSCGGAMANNAAPTGYSNCYPRDGTAQSCSAYVSTSWKRECVCKY